MGNRKAGRPAFCVRTAVDIALAAHHGQLDKAGSPYISHPIRVMERMDSQDRIARAAAVLHDVLEDAALTARDLAERGVPSEVIEAVEILTHQPGEPNVVYWERVREHPIALKVKLADIADNSDPVRLATLYPATRQRLAKKYAHAKRVLLGEE